MKLLVIGSTVVDIHLYMDHLPSREEDRNVYGHKTSLGGCAHNVSHMSYLLGSPYTLFSPVGTGIYGEYVERKLKEKNVEILLRSERENGCCYCLVDDEGSRSFVVVRGAEYDFEKAWFQQLNMDEYDRIYACGLEVEAPTGENLVSFLEEQKDKEIWYAPSARILEIPFHRQERVFDLHPCLHLNRKELCGYVKKHFGKDLEIEEAMYAMHERTKNKIVCSYGKEDVLYFDGESLKRFPTSPVEQVDGTGAGDGHLGTILALLEQGKTIEEAIPLANYVGGLIVEREDTTLKENPFK